MINVVQLFAMYDVNGLIAIIVNVDIDIKYDTTSLPCIEPNVSRIGDNIPFEVNNKNNTIHIYNNLFESFGFIFTPVTLWMVFNMFVYWYVIISRQIQEDRFVVRFKVT